MTVSTTGALLVQTARRSRREQELADHAKQQAQQVAQDKVQPVAQQVAG
jgi:hypothetical protein